MKKKLLPVLALGIAAILPGCTSGQQEMQQIVGVMQRDDPGAYEAVMRKFVDGALAVDADSMVALTSNITISQMGGRRALREHYLKDKIPALRAFPAMSAGGDVIYVSDPDGTVGWTFRKVFTSPAGKKEYFEFTVLKEKGQIKIASAGIWK